jgi:hypothetical protein
MLQNLISQLGTAQDDKIQSHDLLNLFAEFQNLNSSNLLAFLTSTIVPHLQARLSTNQHQISTLNFFLFYYHKAWLEELLNVEIQNIFLELEEKKLLSATSQRTLSMFHLFQWHIIFESLCVKSVVSLCERKIQNLCSDSEAIDDDSSVFTSLRKWYDTRLLKFLSVFFISTSNSLLSENFFEICIEYFVRIRSGKLFEMVTDYPDSIPLLLELKSCIQFQHTYLTIIGKELRKILRKRLLHLGASTSQILDFYVSMIKSLRLIDSSDALLNYVAVPIRQYLKLRKDTIRCIISSLTESKDSELYDELKQGKSLASGIIGEDDEENGPGEQWMPSKRNKELKEENVGYLSAHGLDVLATLVSIYGSTELFIVEYRNLLSEKLVSNFHYTTDQEVANLELLKIRCYYLAFFSSVLLIIVLLFIM